MVDYSKPPICPGECRRCGRIAFASWYCEFCLARPVYVDRTPKKQAVVRLHRSTEYQQMRKAS
jgi:hypothetical protein